MKNILVFGTIIKKVKNNESEEKNRQGSSINNRSLMIYMQNQQLHLFSIYSCVIMNSSIYILVFVQLWLLSLPCRESVCIPSERETLLKFKNNLNDPSNRLWSWNHNHTNCCHWYGVLYHNLTSHVLQLHLNSSHSPLNDDHDWESYRRWSFGGRIARAGR